MSVSVCVCVCVCVHICMCVCAICAVALQRGAKGTRPHLPSSASRHIAVCVPQRSPFFALLSRRAPHAFRPAAAADRPPRRSASVPLLLDQPVAAFPSLESPLSPATGAFSARARLAALRPSWPSAQPWSLSSSGTTAPSSSRYLAPRAARRAWRPPCSLRRAAGHPHPRTQHPRAATTRMPSRYQVLTPPWPSAAHPPAARVWRGVRDRPRVHHCALQARGPRADCGGR